MNILGYSFDSIIAKQQGSGNLTPFHEKKINYSNLISVVCLDCMGLIKVGKEIELNKFPIPCPKCGRAHSIEEAKGAYLPIKIT
jgi:Zn finger protein HypA/HybF involved in hydrogenase expression